MEYKCNRCGHVWSTRLFGAGLCPPSKGSVEDKMFGGLFNLLLKDIKPIKPRKCPHCYSPNWDVPTITVHCFRCNHIWTARKGMPTKCSKCNNPLKQFGQSSLSLREYKNTALCKQRIARVIRRIGV